MSSDQITDQHQNITEEYLTFSLGDEQYGVDILKVKEIRGWESLREMHDVPEYIKGVLDFRGVIVPIVDLRLRFGVAKVEYLATTVIIILSTDNESSMMGIVVDAVSDVLSVKQSDMKKAPSLGSKIKTDYILGMVSGEQGMIMLVDSEKLVDKEQLEVPES
ncbi:MAG: purine-binding chemotaxis protein CheW [Gammaproteobacteria bacterium]|nr:purine-binding chemotaxis protein CheW [Gammaproteobacteria bacterium]MBT3722654.1 purine-binding chemotaxis protein CheW [Gammaproteobacteria bacterium]MBT4075478.1 purine-binding chemotaxis protein CheW [Gammaproteobacteria bacterium]MBT4193026.1 purine-binding chemotaxis protein CheW [Gammaproteobacteria bacterium]MBT4451045.1 purine-binding chemotaxis protein CheW [Gammaproteobacteria bacterium]